MSLNDRKILNSQFTDEDISSLSDTPSADGISATDLKAKFDNISKTIITPSVNGIIDDLQATTDGQSGADNIGVTPIGTSTSETLQGALEDIVTSIGDINTDKANSDLSNVDNGSVTTNLIQDNAITNDKMADNSIGINEIQDNAIIESKISNGAVTTNKIASQAVTDIHIAENSVNTGALQNPCVSNIKIVDNTINAAEKVLDNSITTSKIQDNSITTIKIQNGAITSTKIGTNIIDEANLQNNAVTTNKISNNAVTNSKLATNSVSGDKILSNAITNDKISNNSVSTNKIDDYAISNIKLANGSVTDDKIATETITYTKIANRTIIGDKLALNSIRSTELAPESVSVSEIQNGAVINAKLATNAVTNDKMADNSVGTNELIDGAVTSAKLATNIFDGVLKTDQSTPQTTIPSGAGFSWNITDKTLNIHTGVDGVLQVGQENYLPYTMGLNKTGSIIPNGTVVYLDTDGSETTISPAIANTQEIVNKTVGIVTSNIAINGTGFVTTYGLVRGLTLTSYSCGDTVYLSGTTAGAFTKTEPADDIFKVVLGDVVCVGGEKQLFVRYISVQDPNEITLKYGFPNQNALTSEMYTTNIDGDYIFTILGYPEFRYYHAGKQYRATIKNLTIDDTQEGVHWVYFDGADLEEAINPTSGQIDSIIRTKTSVAQFYWNATNKKIVYFGDERHGHTMDTNTHSYLHFTQKAKWISGMALSGFTIGDGSLLSHAQFTTDSGVCADEDKVFIKSTVIGSPLQCYYISGSTPVLRNVQGELPVKRDNNADINVGTTGRLVYNKNTGGTWSLATVSDNNYVLCHIFATNFGGWIGGDIPSIGYISFIGQNEYSTVANARTGALTEINNIISLLPTQELVKVGTVIYQTKNTYANSYKCRVVVADTATGANYIDWRTTASSGSTIPSTDHNSLGGKQGGTTGEYFHLTSAETTALQTIITDSPDRRLVSNQNFSASWINGTPTVDTGTSVITLTAHGLVDGSPIEFGTLQGVLPTGLLFYDTDNVGGTYYFAKKLSDNTFEVYTDVALTSKVTISSTGTPGWGVRLAGQASITISGLDFNNIQKYRFELSGAYAGFSTCRRTSATCALNINLNGNTSYLHNTFLSSGTGNYNASYCRLFVDFAKKYMMGSFMCRIYRNLNFQYSIFNSGGGQTSDDKSTSPASVTSVVGGAVTQNQQENVTSVVFSCSNSAGYIRNGANVKVYKDF